MLLNIGKPFRRHNSKRNKNKISLLNDRTDNMFNKKHSILNKERRVLREGGDKVIRVGDI